MGYSGSNTASKFRSVQNSRKQFQFFNQKYCKNVAWAPPYTVTDPLRGPILVVSVVYDLCLHLILTCKSDPLKQAVPCDRAWYTDQGTRYRYRPVWGYHGTPEGLQGCLGYHGAPEGLQYCLGVPWDSWRVTGLSGGTMGLLKASRDVWSTMRLLKGHRAVWDSMGLLKGNLFVWRYTIGMLKGYRAVCRYHEAV